jgi:hypothetical protein
MHHGLGDFKFTNQQNKTKFTKKIDKCWSFDIRGAKGLGFNWKSLI